MSQPRHYVKLAIVVVELRFDHRSVGFTSEHPKRSVLDFKEEFERVAFSPV